MKILIFGDIFGRIGRAALEKELPNLKQKYSPDFIIANIENVSSGRGPIEKHASELEALGIDIMTSGDHIFDNEEKIRTYLNKDNSILLRPANFYESSLYKVPGKGYRVFEKQGKKLLVINLISETFMKVHTYNPFIKVEEILKEFENEKLDGIIIDFHKEVSSEGYGMAYFLEGKVSFIYGTHTHIQTNDEVILPGGTGILSDVGMSGAFPSVIGADFSSLKKRFLTGVAKGKIEQSLNNNYVVNGAFVEIEDNKCLKIEKIRINSNL